MAPLSAEKVIQIREEIKTSMVKPGYDDGSLGPLFIRLAWHSSGTYSMKSGTGGSNGATMRFNPESSDPENAGLDKGREFLEPIKAKFPEISYADLWILAAYVFIEESGGPSIAFASGRTDVVDETKVPPNGRLPKADCGKCEGKDEAEREAFTIKHIREIFNRMGFNDQEIVALMSGGHVYGRCHPDRSGYAGPWVEKMTEFSNEYAADMIEDDWKEVTSETPGVAEGMRPAPGKRQFNNEAGKGPQMMLVADMALLWDPEFKKHLERYKEDGEALKKEFGAAFKKLTELNFKLFDV